MRDMKPGRPDGRTPGDAFAFICAGSALTMPTASAAAFCVRSFSLERFFPKMAIVPVPASVAKRDKYSELCGCRSENAARRRS